jgi:4-amino-4-deoxy-L-arabinose transferase-like glycosyltransferase
VLVLAALVVLGLVLRLDQAHDWNLGRPDSPKRLTLGDEPGYDGLARSLLAGRGFDWPGRVPLYPVWVAVLHAITGYHYPPIPYAQAVLGTTVVLLTFLLGRRLFGTAAGLLAALGAAVDVVLVNESGPLLSEVLYTPVLLVAIIALVGAVRRPTGRRLIWAGVAMGLGSLVRPMLFLFPIAAVLLFVALLGRQRGLRSWAVYVVAAFVAMAPWMTYTTLRWDAFIPLQTSNAILWQGSPEYYRLVHDGHYKYLDIWSKVIYGPGWQRHDPTSVEGDRWWTRRALRSIEDDPATYLRFAVEKVGTYWVGDPSADWGDSHIFDYTRLRAIGFDRRDAVGTMAARLLPLLALLAIVVLWRRRRALLPVYAVLIYATLLAAATHAEARLSEPLQPVLVILVAGALVQLSPWRSQLDDAAAPDRS